MVAMGVDVSTNFLIDLPGLHWNDVVVEGAGETIDKGGETGGGG